jgi:predicted nucleic acid-binding Zn ribbon protein
MTLREALGLYLRTSGLNVLLKNQDVYNAWQKVVGPEIASQTRIVGFKRGALTAEVASSGLYAELKTYYLDDLVGAIQKEMKNKKVRKIKLRLGAFARATQNGAE